MNFNKKLVLFALIGIFAFILPAAAYYQPQEGRFMQRDPLGVNPAGGKQNPFSILKQYKDSMNLYGYVKSNPILYNDYNGTQVSDEECCRMAEQHGDMGEKTKTKVEIIVGDKKETIELEVVGIVMCCEGRKISCTTRGYKGDPPLDVDDVGQIEWFIEETIKRCVLEHENRHKRHTLPCEECGVYVALPHPDLDVGLAECAAYRQESNCLKNAETLCEKSKDPESCKKGIEERKNRVDAFAKKMCNN